MKRFACIIAILAVPFAVLAQQAGGGDLDVLGVLAAFVNAIKSGQWPLAAVLGFVAAIWALKRVGTKFIPWLGTSEGGTALAMLTTIGSVLGAAALGGVPITWSLVGKAAATGFSAIGGYVGARRLLRVLAPLVAKIPKVGPWLAKVLDLLSGASAKEEIRAETEAAYKPLSPAPTAGQAADTLSRPPIP